MDDDPALSPKAALRLVVYALKCLSWWNLIVAELVVIRLASKFEGMRICKFEGSKRYFSTRFHIKVCSCLRRDGFRYTTIHSKGFPYEKNIRTSGEAILGTQRYFPKDFLT